MISIILIHAQFLYTTDCSYYKFFNNISCIQDRNLSIVMHKRISHFLYCIDQAICLFFKWFCTQMPSLWWNWLSGTWKISDSNSFSSLTCSGPAIIHLQNADGFSVRPMAPPDTLTISLFCSLHWSIGIAEKRLIVFELPSVHIPQTAHELMKANVPCHGHVQESNLNNYGDQMQKTKVLLLLEILHVYKGNFFCLCTGTNARARISNLKAVSQN